MDGRASFVALSGLPCREVRPTLGLDPRGHGMILTFIYKLVLEDGTPADLEPREAERLFDVPPGTE